MTETVEKRGRGRPVGIKEKKPRAPKKTIKRRTPKIGTIEWQLWRLEVGENYTVAGFLRIDEATEAKIERLKNSLRNRMRNHFKELRDKYGKEFSLITYQNYDKNNGWFAVTATAISLPSVNQTAQEIENAANDL
nr:MAG TPA: hypothetical protein [Caudoviricetes sp.]